MGEERGERAVNVSSISISSLNLINLFLIILMRAVNVSSISISSLNLINTLFQSFSNRSGQIDLSSLANLIKLFFIL